MDISAISAALGSIKTATDIAKLIKDSGTRLEQAEIKLRVAELVSALADAKVEIAEIQNHLIEKEQQIRDLKEQLNFKSKVVWEKPYYFILDDQDKDGPFCQPCYDTSKQLVRLQGGGTNSWHCYSCKGRFADENYIRPTKSRIRRSR